MTDSNDGYRVGFGKPPKDKRFVKGRSGNPDGRPKGSQNPATILDKACRERVQITTNGKTRYISKFKATMLQLTNKAASGDIRAIKELYVWITGLRNFEQATMPAPLFREIDYLVMASIVKRIRQSEPLSSSTEADAVPSDSSTLKESI